MDQRTAEYDLRHADRQLLRQSFDAAYDRSYFEQLMIRGMKAEELIGEGTHFRAWRCPRPGQMTLVVKLAKHEFPARRGAERQAWLAAWDAAVRAELPLVPPFAAHELPEGVAVVMPYAERPATTAAGHWRPLSARLAELGLGLAALGLVLEGLPQLGCRGSLPMLIDLSDLRQR